MARSTNTRPAGDPQLAQWVHRGRIYGIVAATFLIFFLMKEAGSGTYVVPAAPPSNTPSGTTTTPAVPPKAEWEAKHDADGEVLRGSGGETGDEETEAPVHKKANVGQQQPPLLLLATSLVASPPVVVDTHHVTAVIMSYPGSSRLHLLMEIICRLRQWYGLVKEVVLVWNGPLEKMPAHVRRLLESDPYGDCCTSSYFSQKNGSVAKPGSSPLCDGGKTPGKEDHNPRKLLLPLKILPQSLNRIDNRWRIHEAISTQGVLNMDDDVNLARQGAECMFSSFQSSPESIVGIDVRAHVIWSHGGNGSPPDWAYAPTNGGGKKQLFPVGYKARDMSKGYKQYSIVLPRALITNKKYYETYDLLWKDSDSNLRKIVDDTICDDIGFNFVASLVGARVLYAKAKYTAYAESHDATALTKKSGMKQKRQRCVNEFAQMVPVWRDKLRGTSSAAAGAPLGGEESKVQKDYWDSVPLKYRRWHIVCDVDG